MTSIKPWWPISIALAVLMTVVLVAATLSVRAQDDGLTPQDGNIAFVSNRDGNDELYVMAADGSNPRRLTTSPLADGQAIWSPDGTQLAYVTETSPGVTELAVVDVTTAATRTLTAFRGQINHPAWSPDGTRLAFTANHSGNNEIYTVAPDGTGLTNVTNHPADDQWPSWAPDSVRLAFESNRDEESDLYVFSFETGETTHLIASPGVDRNPVWSPDGMRIAFLTERSGNADVFVVDFNGTNLVRLSNTPFDDAAPAWSPDGVFIAYVAARDDSIRELFSVNADGIDERQLVSAQPAIGHPVWSPDGTWVAYDTASNNSSDVYAVNFDSLATIRLTDDPTADNAMPVWSPTTAPPSVLAPIPAATEMGPVLPPPATATTFVLPAPTLTPFVPAVKTPFPTLAPPPTQQPPAVPTASVPPDLMLIYNPSLPSFYLVNVSNRSLNLAGLAFQGDGQQVSAGIWAATMSRSLADFPAGGCLGLWGLGVPVQPQPAGCTHRHGWWESDRVVFWMTGSFVVTNNGVRIATCDAFAGTCAVSLSGATAAAPQPSTGAVAPPPQVDNPNAEVLLTYNAAIPSFYLVNVSGRSINIAGLAFQGNGRQTGASIWASDMSGSLNDFPAGGCLGLWEFGLPTQPQPAECTYRHGWQERGQMSFWGPGDFTATNNGIAIATCQSAAGRCQVDLPG